MIRICSFAVLLLGIYAAVFADDTAQPRKVQVARDLVYASVGSIELTCDVFSPLGLMPGKTIPAVLVIHGGAWSSGSKTMMGNYASQLARMGTVAVAINYRHAPEYKYPAQLDDVRDALVWINDHASLYSIDTNRVGIFGYSAGGHLACMMATLADEPLDRMLTTSSWSANDSRWKRIPKIAAVVAGGPPCDFRDLPPDNTAFSFLLGGSRAECPAAYEAVSPTSFASQGDCPICFIHGERDLIVPIASSQALYEQQIAAGVKSEFVVVDKQGHMITFLHPKTSESMSDYFKHHLGIAE